MTMGFFDKIVNSFSEREIKRMRKIADKVLAMDETMSGLSDAELQGKTQEFRDRIAAGETLDDLLVEAFAVVREAAWRTLGMKHYAVQVVGGIVLHEGRISEMKTGEGKTLVATLAAYLNALDGRGVHVITVNDYLAKRDKEWMGQIYEFLKLEVGCVIHGVEGAARSQAYLADITYGTNNEFGFDYLRDNMVVFQDMLTQRELNYAIIDEVDSILIDEARTPLIISGEGAKSTNLYNIADMFAQSLKKEADFVVDEKAHAVTLTDEAGVVKAEKFFGIENLGDPENMEISHHINQALKARFLMKLDVDYVVKDGEIIIVDEFTGRLMFGRRYSNGLHQAIEAKEKLEVRKESQTLATITLQNYFRLYNKLSGMTGTAKTEEDEFKHIYGMDVAIIPTNRNIQRQDLPDSVFKSLTGKFKNVIENIVERHKMGQPVLVGTISIETSEYLSALLKRQGVPHEVLNAKQHDREAEIIAQAGRYGAVTIATNMAGRGTDILLGGNPDFMTKKELRKRGYDDEEMLYHITSPLESEDPVIQEARQLYQTLFAQNKAITDADAEKVCAAGGLHIMGTERHESRRIDNQLRGRAGRQGDPGSSQFFLSFEDDLMRLFVTDRIKGMVEKLGMDDDMQIEAGILTKSIESAQKKVEARNFGVRKHVLQYDDVMNRQRSIIYAERQKVLAGENLKEHMEQMIEGVVDDAVAMYTADSNFAEEWDLVKMLDHMNSVCLSRDLISVEDLAHVSREELREMLLDASRKTYEAKEEEVGSDRMRELERVLLLRVVDTHWIDHIDAMEQLKQGIGLRAIGQEDPVRAYQIEGFDMFNEMIKFIQEETVRHLAHVTVTTEAKMEQVAKETGTGGNDGPQMPIKNKGEKVGRNDPCPCGSGLKYKKCHGKDE